MVERGLVANFLAYSDNALAGASLGGPSYCGPQAVYASPHVSEEELVRMNAERATAEHEYTRKQKALVIVGLAERLIVESSVAHDVAIEVAQTFVEQSVKFVESYGK